MKQKKENKEKGVAIDQNLGQKEYLNPISEKSVDLFDPIFEKKSQGKSSVKNLVMDYEKKISCNVYPLIEPTKISQGVPLKHNWRKVDSPIQRKKVNSPLEKNLSDRKKRRLKLDLPNLKPDLKSMKDLKSAKRNDSKYVRGQKTIVEIWGPGSEKIKPKYGPSMPKTE